MTWRLLSSPPPRHCHCLQSSQAATHLCLHLLPNPAILLASPSWFSASCFSQRCPYAITFSLGAGVAAGVRQSEGRQNSHPSSPPSASDGKLARPGLSCHPELIARFWCRLFAAEASGVVGDVLVGRLWRRALGVSTGVRHQLWHRPAPIDARTPVPTGCRGCRAGISSSLAPGARDRG